MTLAVRSARLCLDCDILSDSSTCPVCGRNHTFPLVAWMRPLEAESSTRPGRLTPSIPPAKVHAGANRLPVRGRSLRQKGLTDEPPLARTR